MVKLFGDSLKILYTAKLLMGKTFVDFADFGSIANVLQNVLCTINTFTLSPTLLGYKWLSNFT